MDQPEPRTPPGVDPALWAEAKDLSERIHDLLQAHDEQAGEMHRFVIELPEEWVTLAAWLQMRTKKHHAGKHCPSMLPADTMAVDGRIARDLAKSYMLGLIVDNMHAELHQLSTGDHYLLQPPPEKKPPSSPGDLDDSIPF